MEELIIDKEKQYYASIEFWDTGASLCFKSAIDNEEYCYSVGATIQGWADDVFEHLKTYPTHKVMGTQYYEVPTGINNLTMFDDDGIFIIDWSEENFDRKGIEKQIIDFFTKIYFDNKNRIKEEIRKGFAGKLD